MMGYTTTELLSKYCFLHYWKDLSTFVTNEQFKTFVLRHFTSVKCTAVAYQSSKLDTHMPFKDVYKSNLQRNSSLVVGQDPTFDN